MRIGEMTLAVLGEYSQYLGTGKDDTGDKDNKSAKEIAEEILQKSVDYSSEIGLYNKPKHKFKSSVQAGFEEHMEAIKEKAKHMRLSRVAARFARGDKISSAEEMELKKENIELYRKALAMRERAKLYEDKLKSSKTMKEAREVMKQVDAEFMAVSPDKNGEVNMMNMDVHAHLKEIFNKLNKPEDEKVDV